jgi:hypothetical protein
MSYKKSYAAKGRPDKTASGDESKDVPATATDAPDGRDARQNMTKRINEPRRDETDRQAIERGEDEGMRVSIA